MTLSRTLSEWGAFNPTVVAQRHSRNVIKAALVDAKHDIAVLAARVEELEAKHESSITG